MFNNIFKWNKMQNIKYVETKNKLIKVDLYFLKKAAYILNIIIII